MKTLKQLRKSIGKTQEDISKILKCNQSTVSKIEKGHIMGKKYVKYLKYLVKNGVDVNQLFK